MTNESNDPAPARQPDAPPFLSAPNPIPLYGAQAKRPGPSPIAIILIIVAVVFFGICGVAGVGLNREMHSGVHVHGRELSRSELRETMSEIKAMSEGAQAGHPETLSTDVPVKTELGKEFQSMLVNMQTSYRAYEAGIADTTSPDFLSPGQLGSEEGRRKARETINKYMAASKTYEDANDRNIEAIRQFTQDVSGKTPANFEQLKSQMQEIRRLDAADSQSVVDIVDFVGKVKPGYDAAQDRILFQTDDDVAKFRDLVNKMVAAQKMLDTRQAAILRDRQEMMNEAFSSMDKF